VAGSTLLRLSPHLHYLLRMFGHLLRMFGHLLLVAGSTLLRLSPHLHYLLRMFGHLLRMFGHLLLVAGSTLLRLSPHLHYLLRMFGHLLLVAGESLVSPLHIALDSLAKLPDFAPELGNLFQQLGKLIPPRETFGQDAFNSGGNLRVGPQEFGQYIDNVIAYLTQVLFVKHRVVPLRRPADFLFCHAATNSCFIKHTIPLSKMQWEQPMAIAKSPEAQFSAQP
jgi:murein DD-endopeptidase MepM/ murein hydrolase activator NlpD